MPLPPGLFESLVTEALQEQLHELAPDLQDHGALGAADAPDRLALHLATVLRRALEGVGDKERVARGVALARELISVIATAVEDESVPGEQPISGVQVLRGLWGRRPDGTADELARPLVPLLDTTLLTNSPDEPRVGNQILAEIESADQIDVLMAFVLRSGLRPLRDALRRHRDRGRQLRVLTTTFTGSTELEALEWLAGDGADVRVSYDTTGTRLHAKAWVFHRATGFSTAYIGSSNLSRSAQQTGLEWNVRVSGLRNPDVLDKMSAVFESYWNGRDFVPFERAEFERKRERAADAAVVLSPIEIAERPFQQRMLEQIAVARSKGHSRNLLVSATGTGKTVMAAIDYARLRRELPRARLLFVAHRKEILEQSRGTFCHALREPSFGELWVGGKRPTRFDHVFASIQSLDAAGLESLAQDHFDVVIIDEFHHAAAKTYRRLLDHVRPRQLLGLTATPERFDGTSVAEEFFEGRIAAELRLWSAIEEQYLCPFLYFGLNDGTDLRQVPWKRGRGYDVASLTQVLTADEALARSVLKELQDHVDDPAGMRCLGFCVSVDHARFMARVFAQSGVRAVALWGESSVAEREQRLAELRDGTLQVLFSVDLFNEGVDVPDVDSLLFLRPTESATLFLQQLGRGLRRVRGKSACTVLDFVGQHRREFRFDRKLRGLLRGSRKNLERQVRQGFPFLPAGCHMQLDDVAQERVLRSLREALPSRWTEKAAELASIARDFGDVGLAGFLDESGMDLEEVFPGGAGRGWSALREAAGLPVAESGPEESALRGACGRLLHVDDSVRLRAYRAWLARDCAPRVVDLAETERRLLRMLVSSVVGTAIPKSATLQEGADLVWRHPQVCRELTELFEVLEARIDHLHHRLTSAEDVPLMIHARYTRVEMQAAFGVGGDAARIAPFQQGVRSLDHCRSDLLAFTLDKSSGSFSPTTRYRDYAITPELIHWESQGVVREASATGQRYQGHVAMEWSMMLFARLRQDDRAFWFLGPGTYVSHKSERPMQVTWRLGVPLPGDLFEAFAAAVA